MERCTEEASRTEAEEKRRKGDIQMTQINAAGARDQTKIEVDKELALQGLELQTQGQVKLDATSNSPKPPPDKVPAFVDEKK